jgi:hypothetical protein
MATLRELLGTAYKEGMAVEEAEQALANAGKRLFDLSKGEYVSKEKYDDDTKLLNYYKTQAEGKQAEIDAAVATAVEKTRAEAEAAAKTAYEKQLEIERTADKRKRAKEKHYSGLNDEQKGIYDAFLKEEELKLSDDGESFSNFDELSKPIKEKYKTLFPVDDGSHGKAGVKPENAGAAGTASNADMFGFGFMDRANANKK